MMTDLIRAARAVTIADVLGGIIVFGIPLAFMVI